MNTSPAGPAVQEEVPVTRSTSAYPSDDRLLFLANRLDALDGGHHWVPADPVRDLPRCREVLRIEHRMFSFITANWRGRPVVRLRSPSS